MCRFYVTMGPEIIVEFTPRSALAFFFLGACAFALLTILAIWIFVRLRLMPKAERVELLSRSPFLKLFAIFGPLFAPILCAAMIGGTYVEMGDFCRMELHGRDLTLCGPIACEVVDVGTVRSLRAVNTKDEQIRPVIGAPTDPDSSWRVELTSASGAVRRSCKMRSVDDATDKVLRQIEARFAKP